MSLFINLPATPANLIATAVQWIQRGEQIALLTLVNIEGNAPYPIGSQMLVNQRGEYRGQITGGCAEMALAEQAVAAIRNAKNCTHRYGLDSLFFDIQLPCGSGIDVYFDVVTPLAELQHLHQQLQSRSTAHQLLQTGVGAVTKIYQPNPRLIVFGQGPIMASLAQLAVLSGFELICIAQNADNIRQLADLGIRAEEIEKVEQDFAAYCDKHTALVSLFHEHDYETDILYAALQTELFYIGALGSRRTHAARLDSLREKQLQPATLKRIFGPVGLDINAENPAQIAISVLAQIVRYMPKHNDD